MRLFFLGSTVCFLSFFVHQSYSVQYLELSNQTAGTLSQATNYAVLESGSELQSEVKSFTICSSIYVAYFRGYQAFFTILKSGSESPLFSLYLQPGSGLSSGYNVGLYFLDGGALNNETVKLRPHAWSHACTSVDTSGHMTAVINGVLTHDVDTSEQFPKMLPNGFESHLVLGAAMEAYKQVLTYQSEASVTNVNIFSEQLSIYQMKQITSKGKCTQGDLLNWSTAKWTFVGEVKSKEMPGFCQEKLFPYLFNLPNRFSAEECLKLCPRLGKGGRVPALGNLSGSQSLAKEYRKTLLENEIQSPIYVIAPFVSDSGKDFLDFYTKDPMPHDLWVPGQPNFQPFTCQDTSRDDGRLFDIFNTFPDGWRCQCDFPDQPILRAEKQKSNY